MPLNLTARVPDGVPPAGEGKGHREEVAALAVVRSMRTGRPLRIEPR